MHLRRLQKRDQNNKNWGFQREAKNLITHHIFGE